ncbi:MAG: mechanosensitive ion channel, partial [Pyramidobacter sp.]|nr:mechanosensitive ion channel [Pyramidobacter sp.]
VAILTGGTAAESKDVSADVFVPAADAVVAPYQPVLDAEACSQRAEKIRRELEDWSSLKSDAAAARFGVSEEAVVRRLETFTTLKNIYPEIVSALARKTHIEAMLAKQKEDMSAPELALTEKPPYTLNYYSAYIDQLEDLNRLIDDAQYNLAHAEAAAERAQKHLGEREAEWRLARDNFVRQNTSQTSWQVAGAALMAEAARAQQLFSALKRENAAAVLSGRKLARDRHLSVRNYIRDHLDLEEKSFEAQVAELDACVKETESQLAHLNQQHKKAQDALEAAQMKYDTAGEEKRADALIERGMCEDERDGVRQKLDHVQGQLDIFAARRRGWTLRYDIARGAADLAAIPDRVRELADEVQLLDEQLAMTQRDMLARQGRLAAVQKQIDEHASDPAALTLLNRDRASLQSAVDEGLAYAEILFSMRAQDRALIDELQEKYRTVSLPDKVLAWWQTQGVRLLETELWQSGGYAVRLREFLIALALIVLGNWGARRAFALLLWLLSKKFSIDETSRRSLTRLFSCLAGMVIFLGALRIVGIPVAAVAVLGGAVAIGIGFGTQDLFKNLMSGILLTLKRPFRLGNVIEVSGVIGTVTDIGVAATIIRTFDEKYAVIPNSDLLEKELINWSLSDTQLSSTITVGIVYGTSPDLVRKTLLSVAAAEPDVLKDPEPWVRISNFGDSSLDFTLCYWIDQRESSVPAVSALLREDILRSFDETGISMAYPRLDVMLCNSVFESAAKQKSRQP